MAITITRTPWIDDDGTGTTGTVLNNAVKTDLYNQIDGALAKAAQLVGGNTFTGNQAIAGQVSATFFGTHTFVGSGSGQVGIGTQNTSASGSTAITVGNDTNANLTALAAYGSTFGAGGVINPNGSLLQGNGAGGLTISASVAMMRVFTGGAERVRVLVSGEVLINNTTNPGNAMLMIVSDMSVRNANSVQNSNPANTGFYNAFFNSAGTVAGSITQTGVNSVAFQTTSDRRLKTDRGRASDLSALRAVVVHDFTWNGDGVRDRGVFAQELALLFPRAVTEGTDKTTDDGALVRPWMTDNNKLVPDLIVGWQQHDAAIAELRAAVAALKG